MPVWLTYISMSSWFTSNCYLESRTYREIVRQRATRRDRTLRRADNAVHLRCAILIQTVEMERSGLVAELVVHIDDNLVAHIDSDLRDRPLVVDANDRSVEGTIRVSGDPSDVEVIGDRVCDDRGGEQDEACHQGQKLCRGHSSGGIISRAWMLRQWLKLKLLVEKDNGRDNYTRQEEAPARQQKKIKMKKKGRGKKKMKPRRTVRVEAAMSLQARRARKSPPNASQGLLDRW